MGKSKKFQKEVDGKFERRLEPRKTKHLPYGIKPNVASKNGTYSGHNKFVYIPDGGEFYIKDIDKSWPREETKRLIRNSIFEYEEKEFPEDEIKSFEDDEGKLTEEEYEKYKQYFIN